MKKFPYKFFLIIPTLIITSCGYGLKEVYKGIPYNSGDYLKDYYHVWDKTITHQSDNKAITERKPERILDYEKDQIFTRLENVSYPTDDAHFHNVEPRWLTYAYTYDKLQPQECLEAPEEDLNKTAYGPSVKMSSIDSSFKYGVISKLFDGQMFCNGDFQNSRVQVGPQHSDYNGFSVKFSKECTYSEYFMCNFKCSVVTDKSQNIGPFLTDLTLHLGFYLRNENGYTYVPVSYSLKEVPTNSGDDHSVAPFSGRLSMYVCFGFKLHNESEENEDLLDLSRLAGLSFEYSLDKVYKKGSTTPYDFLDDTMYHAIMLYEISLPHSSWH